MRAAWSTLALLLLPWGAGCFHSTKPEPKPEASSAAPDISSSSVGIAFKSSGRTSRKATTRNGCYAELAHDMLWRIGELRRRYPQFAKMNPEDLSWQEPVITNEKLWIGFRYENAAELAPATDAKSGVFPPARAFLKEDGIALRVYFFTGNWPGHASVQPKLLDEMKITYFVDVPDPVLQQKLVAELDQIVAQLTAELASDPSRRCAVPGKKP